MDFNVVMSMGDTGVVDWCRKDAEAASKEYQQALRENPSQQLRSVLERQMGEIRATVASLEQVLRTVACVSDFSLLRPRRRRPNP
jgi:hypothetical protein